MEEVERMALESQVKTHLMEVASLFCETMHRNMDSIAYATQKFKDSERQEDLLYCELGRIKLSHGEMLPSGFEEQFNTAVMPFVKQILELKNPEIKFKLVRIWISTVLKKIEGDFFETGEYDIVVLSHVVRKKKRD